MGVYRAVGKPTKSARNLRYPVTPRTTPHIIDRVMRPHPVATDIAIVERKIIPTTLQEIYKSPYTHGGAYHHKPSAVTRKKRETVREKSEDFSFAAGP